jgi:hypothetical protein
MQSKSYTEQLDASIRQVVWMFLREHIPSDILRRWRFYPIRLLFDLFTLLAVEEECPRVPIQCPKPRSGERPPNGFERKHFGELGRWRR